MPKVAASFVDGRYIPEVLTKEQVKEYEMLGYKPAEVPQEIMDQWKEHCQVVKSWNNYWMEVENKLWEE